MRVTGAQWKLNTAGTVGAPISHWSPAKTQDHSVCELELLIVVSRHCLLRAGHVLPRPTLCMEVLIVHSRSQQINDRGDSHKRPAICFSPLHRAGEISRADNISRASVHLRLHHSRFGAFALAPFATASFTTSAHTLLFICARFIRASLLCLWKLNR